MYGKGGENLRWFPPNSISVFHLLTGSDAGFYLTSGKGYEKVQKTHASQGGTFSDFTAQRSPNGCIWDIILMPFRDNLDLLVLATRLVRKPCFRDLKEVRIWQFWMTFQRRFQSDLQRRTFRDFGGFGGQKGTQFGLPTLYRFGVLWFPAQDGTQVVPGQATRVQIV